jgi:two-component system OmpR family response regulator
MVGWSMKDSRQPLSVLVVDDCPDTVESTADVLEHAGYSARIALNGPDALRLAVVEPPDVVLLDIMMPGMDGCEVARRIAAQKGVKPPLIVAITGCMSETDRERATAAGVHLYLIKPVDPAFLIGMMRRFQESHVLANSEVF